MPQSPTKSNTIKSSSIIYGCQVNQVVYVEENVQILHCQDGRKFYSNYTIVAVPLSILQDGDIHFLPSGHFEQLMLQHPGYMWPGIKIFIKFKTKFQYDDPTQDKNSSQVYFYWSQDFQDFNPHYEEFETEEGENFFWDNSHDSTSQFLLLAGYLVGKPYDNFMKIVNDQKDLNKLTTSNRRNETNKFIRSSTNIYPHSFKKIDEDNHAESIMINDDDHDDGGNYMIVKVLLDMLDAVFDNQASSNYMDSFIMNWNNMPHIRGAYSSEGYDTNGTVPSLENKIWFAGEAFPLEQGDHGFVYGAYDSGEDAAMQIMALMRRNSTDRSTQVIKY